MNRSRLAALLAAACISLSVLAQQGDGTQVQFQTNVFKPAKVEATQARVQALKAPAGFTVSVFASSLKNARILAVAPNGTVYVSRRDQGDIVMLVDRNGDGQASNGDAVLAR